MACSFALALVVGAGYFCACLPAMAADAPFDFDDGRWTSSKVYNENLRRHPPELAEDKDEAAEPAPNFVSEINVQSPPVVASPAPKPSTTAFLMPAMPGMNKGFELRVNSTEDVKEKKNHALASEIAPDIRLSDERWKTPSTKYLLAKERENEDQETPPLNVRMTFLPSQNMPPVPSAQHESVVAKGHDQLRMMSESKKNEAAKTPEEVAACAALDAYKKQQLDAIQSDRQTLTALQKAIHSLGLGKDLDFMTERESVLNTSSNQTQNPLGAPKAPDIR